MPVLLGIHRQNNNRPPIVRGRFRLSWCRLLSMSVAGAMAYSASEVQRPVNLTTEPAYSNTSWVGEFLGEICLIKMPKCVGGRTARCSDDPRGD